MATDKMLSPSGTSRWAMPPACFNSTVYAFTATEKRRCLATRTDGTQAVLKALACLLTILAPLVLPMISVAAIILAV